MSQLGVGCNILDGPAPGWQAPVKGDPDQRAAAATGEAAIVNGECLVIGRRGRATVCPCPAWKRAMDLAGAGIGLVILSPLFLAMAVFIRCVSPGPAFFRQVRFGAAGRPFILWKFRTMHLSEAAIRHRAHVSELVGSDKPLKKLDEELAVIPGGRLFRTLGLDELPQLLNVLRGEMSLVGPRPDVLPLRSYQRWHRCRFDVMPGITGLWQVSGKNETTFSTMMRLDVLYVRRRSFWLDLMILLRTIPAVLRN